MTTARIFAEHSALFSVLTGLVRCAVIAVPTSIGYGVAEGGRAALYSALASCASGLSVVNIDNGFGAAHAACAFSGTRRSWMFHYSLV